MALNKSVQLALLLTAKTGPASRAIDQFTSKAQHRLNALKRSATDWSSSGSRNIMQGLAIAAPLVYAVKEAAKLEDKVADVAKVVNVGFGTKAFDSLSQGAMRTGEFLGRSADEAAELMAELAAGGVAKDRLEGVAQSAGKIGVAFGVSAGQAGSSFMMIRNAMNLTEAKTMQVMDAMNAATNRFGGKASYLLEFMAQGAAGVSQTLKIAGADMQAFGNSMQVVGITSSEAATTMQRFQKAILKNAELLKIFKNAGGGSAGVLAILERAKKSGDAFSYLNKRGVGEYSTNVSQMANNLDAEKGARNQLKFVSKETNISGSADKEFQARQRTSIEQYNKLKTGINNTAITLGSALLPVMNDLMTTVKPYIKSLTDWIGRNPKLTAQILKGVAALAALKIGLGSLKLIYGTTIGPMAKVAGFFIKNAEGVSKFTKTLDHLKTAKSFLGRGLFNARFFGEVYIRSAFKAVSTFSKALGSGLVKAFSVMGKAAMIAGRFLIANPIILIATGIAVAAFLIIKNWDKIRPWFIKLWGNIKKIFKATWDWIKNMFLNYTPHGLIIKNWDKIKGFFVNLWTNVKSVFLTTWEWIKNLFFNYTPHGLVIKHWDKLRGFFKGLWDDVKAGFMRFINWFVEKWNWLNRNILQPLGKAFSMAPGGPTPQLAMVPGVRRPVPVPVRGSGSNSFSYSPTIHFNGSADRKDVEKTLAQNRRDFERRMRDYSHERERKENA